MLWTFNQKCRNRQKTHSNSYSGNDGVANWRYHAAIKTVFHPNV